ncbi:hypothetical protein D3C85_1199980 [compost metagenome]
MGHDRFDGTHDFSVTGDRTHQTLVLTNDLFGLVIIRQSRQSLRVRIDSPHVVLHQLVQVEASTQLVWRTFRSQVDHLSHTLDGTDFVSHVTHEWLEFSRGFFRTEPVGCHQRIDVGTRFFLLLSRGSSHHFTQDHFSFRGRGLGFSRSLGNGFIRYW